MDIDKLKIMLKIVRDKVEMDLEGTSGMTTDVIESFDWLVEEIDEAKKEYTDKKQVYLEDELCDIVWTVCRIIELLSKQWSIDKNRIFDRVIKKYTERVYWLKNGRLWDDIKKDQSKGPGLRHHEQVKYWKQVKAWEIQVQL